MKQRIGFIYYTFFPVVGGASVHGYNLARELHRLGYELWKINGDPDPWTVKKSKGIAGLLKIFRHCGLVYVRMDYFINLRNVAAVLALIFRKKVIVELNSPSDELRLFGRGRRYIRIIDAIYGVILRRADAVIVVSSEIETYCREALGLENVTVIENGGEIFDADTDTDSIPAGGGKPVSSPIPSVAGENEPTTPGRFQRLRDQYRTVIIWSGSANEMQHLGWISEIATQLKPDQALVLALYDEGQAAPGLPEADNIRLVRNPNRQTVSQLIRQSDIGLAFYRTYPWSRWGFYNSSLKVQEYLVNGLLAVTNIEGSTGQRKHPGFRQAIDLPAVMEIIGSFKRAETPATSSGRTWTDVAADTERVIERVLNG